MTIDHIIESFNNSNQSEQTISLNKAIQAINLITSSPQTADLDEEIELYINSSQPLDLAILYGLRSNNEQTTNLNLKESINTLIYSIEHNLLQNPIKKEGLSFRSRISTNYKVATISTLFAISLLTLLFSVGIYDWRILLTSSIIYFISYFSQLYILGNNKHYFTGRDLTDAMAQRAEILNGKFPTVIAKPPGPAIFAILAYVFLGDGSRNWVKFNIITASLFPVLSFIIGSILIHPLAGTMAALFCFFSPAFIIRSVLGETSGTFFSIIGLGFAAIATIPNFPIELTITMIIMGSCYIVLAYLCRSDASLHAITFFAILYTQPPQFLRITAPSALLSFVLLNAIFILFCKKQYGAYSPIRYDSYMKYWRIFQASRFMPPTNSRYLERLIAACRETGIVPESDLNSLNFLSWAPGWAMYRNALRVSLGSFYLADRHIRLLCSETIRHNLSRYLTQSWNILCALLLLRPTKDVLVIESADISRNQFLKFKSDKQPIEITNSSYLDSIEIGTELSNSCERESSGFSPMHFAYINNSHLTIYTIYFCIAVGLTLGSSPFLIAALTIPVLSTYCAYALSGCYAFRYVEPNSWLLWTASGLALGSIF